MALVISSGVLINNVDPWVTYYILNSELTQVYRTDLVNDQLQLVAVEEPENNPQIADTVTSIMYFLAITGGVLWLDNGEDDCTNADVCAKLDEMITLITDVKEKDVEQTDAIVELSNGWKIIS